MGGLAARDGGSHVRCASTAKLILQDDSSHHGENQPDL
jgi:hypothetical protein